MSIEAFAPPHAFKANVDGLVRDLRASRRMDGAGPIRIPGEASHATFLERRASGIPLPRPLQDALSRLGGDLGIEFAR